MNRRPLVSAVLAAAGLFTASSISGQQRTLEPDLAKLADGKGLEVFDGVAYLQGIEFSNGTIELDVRGKDVQQQSFVGVAFHGVDGTTYDVRRKTPVWW